MQQGEILRRIVAASGSFGQADVRLLVVAREKRAVREPLDEEEPVAVRVNGREEAPAPRGVFGRVVSLYAARDEEFVELVNVLDRDEKIYSAPALRHRTRPLRER